MALRMNGSFFWVFGTWFQPIHGGSPALAGRFQFSGEDNESGEKKKGR